MASQLFAPLVRLPTHLVSLSAMQDSNPQYPNPPIRETVCEIAFDVGPDPWDLSFPGLIYNELRTEFPRRIQAVSPEQVLSITFGNVGSQGQGIRSGEPVQSLRFWRQESDDGMITVTANRISISHYRPYPSWRNFKDIIDRAYDAYVKVVRPQNIQRIGLRYINEIQFNAPSVGLSQYFTYYPNLGPDLPPSVWNVQMSVDFAYNDHRDLARLQLETITGADGTAVAVLLDIDYFLAIPGAVSLTSTQHWLDQAHAEVNSIFEGSITDSTRAMFGRREAL